MALKKEQINHILRKYDEKQLKNRRELQERENEIFSTIPAIRELEQELASNAVKATKQSLLGYSNALEELKNQNQSLKEAKIALLTANGYPADYLTLKYNCPDCKDTGYITNDTWLDEEHILLSKNKCHCFKQAVVDLLYTQSGIQNAIERENFSTFSYDYFSRTYIDQSIGISAYDNAINAVSKCETFIKNFDQSHENLLIYGNTGVGKTFLTNCIAKELLSSAHIVIYLTAFQLFDILERRKFSKAEQDYDLEEKFQGILNCDLLIIDDLGTELSNSFINSQLYLVINERLLTKKSVIISTNLPLDDLSKHYSERIFSRIASNYIMVKMFGEDIRLKKAFAP